MNDIELPIIDKPIMQIGLAVANGVGATLLFKESKGEKRLYGFAAGILLLFTSYHIWKTVDLLTKRAV